MEISRQYDQELQLQFLQAYLSLRKQISKACREVGIPVSTFYTWRKNDPEFVLALQIADEEFTAMLKAVVYEAALSGVDPTLTMQVVERDDPRWDLKLRAALALKATPQGWTESIPKNLEANDPFDVTPLQLPPPPKTEPL